MVSLFPFLKNDPTLWIINLVFPIFEQFQHHGKKFPYFLFKLVFWIDKEYTKIIPKLAWWRDQQTSACHEKRLEHHANPGRAEADGGSCICSGYDMDQFRPLALALFSDLRIRRCLDPQLRS